ncbi:MAG: hypothetical protein IKD02_01215 [Clostridia bacterium]|nr:hypothetical protein [Clostridia bacterium]
MGFGYLLIGYLVTFVIHMTLDSLGLGSLALLLGYGIMMLGLFQLNRFHSAFAYSKWLLLPLMLTAIYEGAASLSEKLLLEAALFAPSVVSAASGISGVLVVVFHLALLLAIRALAEEVGLPSIRLKATANMILVTLYAALYLLAELPLLGETLRGYLLYPVVLLQLAWIVCNRLLLLNCAKDICPEGEDEPAPKRYRWNLLNRIGDAYERNRQRNVDLVTREAEERLEKRREAREKKKIQHSKKKK